MVYSIPVIIWAYTDRGEPDSFGRPSLFISRYWVRLRAVPHFSQGWSSGRRVGEHANHIPLATFLGLDISPRFGWVTWSDPSRIRHRNELTVKAWEKALQSPLTGTRHPTTETLFPQARALRDN